MARGTVAVGDRVVVSDPAATADAAALTWAVWFYQRSAGLGSTLPRLMSRTRSDGTEVKRLIMLGAARLIGAVNRAGGTAQAVVDGQGLGAGAWVHVAMTYDNADGVRLFLNGVEPSYTSRPVASGDPLADAGGDLLFFNRSEGDTTFDGMMAEAGIWNRVLSAAEIMLLASRRYSPRLIRDGLAAYWPLSGVAAPEPELVNGYHGVVTGTAAESDPPGLIRWLPERPVLQGAARGALRRMG